LHYYGDAPNSTSVRDDDVVRGRTDVSATLRAVARAGWQYLHLAIGDHSRLCPPGGCAAIGRCQTLSSGACGAAAGQPALLGQFAAAQARVMCVDSGGGKKQPDAT
jgi:hypothetical protein